MKLNTYCECCKLPIYLPDIESPLVCEECYSFCIDPDLIKCSLMVTLPVKKLSKRK